MSKYNFGTSGSSNGGNNYDNSGYASVFKVAPFTKMRGKPISLFVTSSDYGQSVAVTYKDASIVDGILTKRTDKDQYKLFSWDDAPVLENEDLSCDDLPPVMNKSYAGNSYKYEIVAARLQEDEEVGYDDDAVINGEDYEGTDEIPLEDLLVDDDGEPDSRFTVFEGSSEDGPSSCAKATATVMSDMGRDAVLDEDSSHNWMDENTSLRDDVQDVEVMYAKVQRDSNESDYSFNFPVFILTATGDSLNPVDNSSNVSQSNENGGGEEQDVEETENGSGPLDEFYDTCEELQIDTEPAVKGLLDDMIEDEDNDLQEDVVDRDEIVADLVA